jgi:hypothetical protein
MSRPSEYRAFTVHGPQVGLAMLRGVKRVETRNTPFPRGWYSVHVGGKSLKTSLAVGPDLIKITWPDAPAELELPMSCIVGRVHLSKVVRADAAAGVHSWVVRSAGAFSMVISQAVEFLVPILEIRGHQSIWYVKPPDVQQALRDAIANDNLREFPPLFADLADMRPPPAVAVGQRWTRAVALRKTRSDAGKRKTPQNLEIRPSRRAASFCGPFGIVP